MNSGRANTQNNRDHEPNGVYRVLMMRILLIILFIVAGAGRASADAKLVVDTSESGPIINKNIYGQFIEHLGRAMYDGIWVGPDSDTPNTRGWRNDVVAALKDLHIPVLRWPGGCFADTYHWRDGIGPAEQRPTGVNILWGEIPETNAVGTHEYFDLIEQLGAESYVNGNLGTGTPREMAEWVEYMTGGSEHGLAALRRANGRDKPFILHHFGIGNESWGCGGAMTPEYYTSLYKHWSVFLRTPWDYPIKTQWIASGGHGYGDDVNHGGLTQWSGYLTANIKPDFLLGFNGVSFHYYTHPQGGVFSAKGPAVGFNEQAWIAAISNTLKMDGFLAANRAVMDKHDPENSIALYVDEWGAWNDPTPGTNPAFLQQAATLRDAIISALNFHIFHRHAERVKMANIAQMVNVLQAPVLTQGKDMVLTPTYYAFRLYAPFQNARRLNIDIADVPVYSLGKQSVPAISASAALSEDHGIVLGFVNSDPTRQHLVTIALTDKALETISDQSLRGQLLTAQHMDTQNSFSEPNAVVPVAFQAEWIGDRLQVSLPPKSIVVLKQR